MKTFAIGDIHGAYRALVQVLERSGFDYQNDKLICLGDVTDGWSETAEAIEHLLSIKNLIYIKGNHDDWVEKFLPSVIKSGENTPSWFLALNWISQGGRETYQSYLKNKNLVEKHIEFLRNANLYHIDDDNRIFVHAGFNPERPIDKQKFINIGKTDIYYWDRTLWTEMKHYDKHNVVDSMEIKPYKEVYIGHTPTIRDYDDKPVNIGNLWNLDTGAGSSGKLTIMDVDTKEFTQSDPVYTLYPDEKGRNREKLV